MVCTLSLTKHSLNDLDDLYYFVLLGSIWFRRNFFSICSFIPTRSVIQAVQDGLETHLAVTTESHLFQHSVSMWKKSISSHKALSSSRTSNSNDNSRPRHLIRSQPSQTSQKSHIKISHSRNSHLNQVTCLDCCNTATVRI